MKSEWQWDSDDLQIMEYDATAKPLLDKMVIACQDIEEKLDPHHKNKIRIELAIDQLKIWFPDTSKDSKQLLDFEEVETRIKHLDYNRDGLVGVAAEYVGLRKCIFGM